MTKLAILSALFAAACGTPFPGPGLVERERVLAAKLVVDDAPAHAWPAPGEAATLTWITAAPDGDASFSWALAACPAATSAGPMACAGPPFAAAAGDGTPALPFITPLDIATDALVVFGAACADGQLEIADDGAASCDDGAQPERLFRHVFVAYAEPNRNPSLADDAFTVAKAPWAASADTACGDLPTVRASDDTVLLGVTVDDLDRELFTTTTGEQRRESLELSAFATAGELRQPHAYVDPDDPRALASVGFEWEPPSGVGDDGVRVRFTFVVRDRRGGVDAAVRDLCVVP